MTWESGNGIRPIFTDPVTYLICIHQKRLPVTILKPFYTTLIWGKLKASLSHDCSLSELEKMRFMYFMD